MKKIFVTVLMTGVFLCACTQLSPQKKDEAQSVDWRAFQAGGPERSFIFRYPASIMTFEALDDWQQDGMVHDLRFNSWDNSRTLEVMTYQSSKKIKDFLYQTHGSGGVVHETGFPSTGEVWESDIRRNHDTHTGTCTVIYDYTFEHHQKYITSMRYTFGDPVWDGNYPCKIYDDPYYSDNIELIKQTFMSVQSQQF